MPINPANELLRVIAQASQDLFDANENPFARLRKGGFPSSGRAGAKSFDLQPRACGARSQPAEKRRASWSRWKRPTMKSMRAAVLPGSSLRLG